MQAEAGGRADPGDGVGARVRALRLERGLSQADLSGPALSPSYVSLIEAGKRDPGPQVLRHLAEVLGTSERYLREGRHDPGEALPHLVLDYVDRDLAEGRVPQALERLEGLLSRSDLREAVRELALLRQARALERLGRLEDCVDVLAPVHARAQAGVAAVTVCQTGVTMCRALLEAGDLHQAGDVGAAALAAAHELGLDGTTEQLRLAATVMAVHYERGDLLHAEHLAHRLLEGATDGDSSTGRGGLHWNAAMVAEARGNLDEALYHSRRALSLMAQDADEREVACLRVASAWILLRLDRPDVATATEQLGQAWPVLERAGGAVDRSYWHDARSRAALLDGDAEQAEREAVAALECLDGQVRLEACQARVALGDALTGQGRTGEAGAQYRQAADVLQMMSASRQAGELWRDLGERLMSAGDAPRAAQAFRAALDSVGVRAGRPLDKIVHG